MCTKMSNTNERIHSRIKRSLIIFCLFIVHFSFAQKPPTIIEFENVIVLKMTMQDTTKFTYDTSYHTCGKFIFKEHDIVFREENKKDVNYIIVDQAIHLMVNDHVVYYKCKDLDILLEDDQVIVYKDLKNQTINIGKFVNDKYYIYTYLIKQPYDH